jgi:hypothetical protein
VDAVDDLDVEAEGGGEGGGGLLGAGGGGGVHGADPAADDGVDRQPLGQRGGLGVAQIGERRTGRAGVEGVDDVRGGLAVADQDEAGPGVRCW